MLETRLKSVDPFSSVSSATYFCCQIWEDFLIKIVCSFVFFLSLCLSYQSSGLHKFFFSHHFVLSSSSKLQINFDVLLGCLTVKRMKWMAPFILGYGFQGKNDYGIFLSKFPKNDPRNWALACPPVWVVMETWFLKPSLIAGSTINN